MLESSKLVINQPAPDFTLPDLDGQLHTIGDLSGQTMIINFWSAKCPWSLRVDQALAKHMQNWGDRVIWLSVASNLNEGKDLLLHESSQRGLPLVLHDENHLIADLYGALTTPHLFVLDAERILRYQGAFDDVTFRQREPTQDYLVMAVSALLQGEPPQISQTDSYGCTIVRQLP